MYSISGRSPTLNAIVALLLVLEATGAVADSRVPLTLAEAEDIALHSEPGFDELRATAIFFEERSVAVGQLPDPTLRLEIANYPISGGNFSTEGMTQAKFGIRQAFPRGRLRSKNTAEFSAMASVQLNNAEARARQVLEATRASWLESYYWQNSQQILTESRPLFADLLQVTRSLYSVGRKTQSDVLRAELEIRRLDERLIEASRARSAAQGALSQWLGIDAHRPAANKFPDWEQPPMLESLREDVASHPLLHAANAQIDVREAKVGIAEEKGKPGWALNLGYAYREGFLPNGEPRSDFVSLSVVVDLPMFKKNRQDRNLAAALSARSAAVSGRSRVVAELQSRLDIEYSRWRDLTRRLALYESDILSLSSVRAEAAMLAYQSDAGDFSDVMLGQIDHLNIRLEHLRLQVDRAQSYAMLAYLGGISQ